MQNLLPIDANTPCLAWLFRAVPTSDATHAETITVPVVGLRLAVPARRQPEPVPSPDRFEEDPERWDGLS